MAKRKTARLTQPPALRVGKVAASSGPLLEDLRSLILQTRERVSQAVNSALVLLFWEVGHRIRTDVLMSLRAEYGEEIVPTLSTQLIPEFGKGFSARNLFRMIRFSEVFEDREIIATLSRQLGWSHDMEEHRNE